MPFAYNQYLNPNDFPLVTESVISLKNDKHNSEGFLITLNGVIYHFYREDIFHTHTSNTGKIVMRKSYDEGETWTEPITIYNSEYDDRNIHGGVTSDNKIILTFRKFDAFTNQHIEYCLLYSDDFGNTWHGPFTIHTNGTSSGTNKIFGNNEIGYYNTIYNSNYCELRHSWDGINWDSIVYIWDYRFSDSYKISEVCIEYFGNGTMIALFRNDKFLLGETFLQAESFDYGKTWTEPKLTNIADGFFCPSPLIFYYKDFDDVWVIATDRRGDNGHPLVHNDSHVWLYKANPDEIFGNPTGYKLFLSFQRPNNTFYRFYGYPCHTFTPSGNILVIYTESENTVNGEIAFFYQFKIIYNLLKDNYLEQNSNNFIVYPNPTPDIITFKVNSFPFELAITNTNGNIIFKKNYNYNLNNTNSMLINLNVSFLPAGVYILKIIYKNEIKKAFFLKI